MCACTPAQSRRGLLVQLRELDIAARSGDTDRAAQLVAVITTGVGAIVPDDIRGDKNIATLRSPRRPS
jgi:hypothetical protein